jgi:hypothetical protein
VVEEAWHKGLVDGRLEEHVRSAWCCGIHWIMILSAALAGIEQAQRWFGGLELSFEFTLVSFSKGVTYIDEGLLDLPVMEFRQMDHSRCTQPTAGVYCRT